MLLLWYITQLLNYSTHLETAVVKAFISVKYRQIKCLIRFGMIL
jgi:hypothetical protein